MDDIINLDAHRREKEDEEAEAIHAERHYLGITLKNVLREIQSLEDRAERLQYRDAERQARRELAAEENNDAPESWFTRTLNYIVRDKTPQDD